MEATPADLHREEPTEVAARRGLRLVLWALGASVATQLVAALSAVLLSYGGSGGPGEPPDGLLEHLLAIDRIYWRVHWVIAILALGACAAGLRPMRRAADARARRWASVALVAIVIKLALAVAFIALWAATEWYVVAPALGLPLQLAHSAADITLWTGLALHCAGRLRSRGLAAGSGLVLAVAGLAVLRELVGPLTVLLSWSPTVVEARVWLHGAIPAILVAAGFALLAVLGTRVLRHDTRAAPADPQAAWNRAARGLHLFATGLMARIVTVFTGALVTWLVAFPDGGLTATPLVAVIALAQLVPLAYMTVGGYRLTALPTPYHSRRKAVAALLCVLMSLAAELYSFLLIVLPLDAAGLSPFTFSYFTAATHLLIPIALVLLLSGARAIAEHIGRRELARRARILFAMLLGAAALFALLRSGMADGGFITLLMIFTVTALGLAALGVLFAVAGTFNALAAAMSETRAPATAASLRSRAGLRAPLGAPS